MIPDDLPQERSELVALRASSFDEAFGIENAEDGESRSAGKRIATKRRPVGAGGQRARQPFRGQHRANGDAAGEPFGEGHRISAYPAPGSAEESSQSANARLHLVDQE